MVSQRYSGEWMVLPDDRLLELLCIDGSPRSVGWMFRQEPIRTSDATVSRRCSKLAKYGLLNAHGNGVYSISEFGTGYLKGVYDVSCLDRVDSEEEIQQAIENEMSEPEQQVIDENLDLDGEPD